MPLRIGILTISDRSFHGERADTSGPAIAAVVQEQAWQVVKTAIISDDYEKIKDTLCDWSDADEVDLILTSGGTGFAPRDVTPEATKAIIQREAPGLTEVMRHASLKITPHAMLSRSIAGIRNKTLIINLPGSPKAGVENLTAILAVLPHAIELLQDHPDAESGHHQF